MKKSLIKPSVDHIETSIRTIRGEKTILDADLAQLYGIETKVLVQAVKRNLGRFPTDFHVPTNSRRVRVFEVTICDLKRQGWQAIHAI